MKPRWKELTIAFLMAVVLWYGVSGSEKVESLVEVRVDYRGLPHGMVVRSGLVNKIDVRVRAPIGTVRSLSSRNTIFYMDLSSVRKGDNLLLFDSSQLPFRHNIEVMDITPSRITLSVDEIGSKQVPLAADISGRAKGDYVAQVSFSPTDITISGASSLLELIDTVRIPVELDENTALGISESTLRVPVPEGVEANPSEVKLTLHVGIKRKLVNLTRNVNVEVPSFFGKFVRPDKVNIQVAVPESLASSAASNKDIRAFVNLDQFELGSYSLPVLVSLPEGMELVKIEPAQVTITLEQQRQPPPDKPRRR